MLTLVVWEQPVKHIQSQENTFEKAAYIMDFLITSILHACFIPFINHSTPGIDREEGTPFTKSIYELDRLILLFQSPLVSAIHTKPYLQKLPCSMTQETGHQFLEHALLGAKLIFCRGDIKKIKVLTISNEILKRWSKWHRDVEGSGYWSSPKRAIPSSEDVSVAVDMTSWFL